MSPVPAHCLLHPDREAVARCPECRRPGCRECVVEHEGRLLCARCLARRMAPAAAPRDRPFVGWLTASLQAGAGLGLLWVLFYLLGWLLLRIPTEWHEGQAAARILLGP